MSKQTKEPSSEVHIINVERGEATFCILGSSPLFSNCLSNKAKHELLLPSGRKTEADKRTSMKHDPYEEFRSSVYWNPRRDGKTFVQHLSSAFRGAMRSAALDLPGVSKSEVGRMLWVAGDRVDIYGIPQIDLRIVRQAGMNRTPDVRSRCIMREWACSITVSFTKPQMKEQAVANLLAASGLYIGVGDYRNEKGAGNYGLYEIVSHDNADYRRVIATGGRKVQEAAMENPEPYNEETAELLSWFGEALKKHRTFAPATSAKNGKSKRNAAEDSAS